MLGQPSPWITLYCLVSVSLRQSINHAHALMICIVGCMLRDMSFSSIVHYGSHFYNNNNTRVSCVYTFALRTYPHRGWGVVRIAILLASTCTSCTPSPKHFLCSHYPILSPLTETRPSSINALNSARNAHCRILCVCYALKSLLY